MARNKNELLFEEAVRSAASGRRRHVLRVAGTAGAAAGTVPELETRPNRPRWERRRRWGQAAVAVVAAGLLGAGIFGLWQRVVESPEFHVRAVTYRTDGVLEREEVMEAAGPVEGEHILVLNLARMARRIERLPLVESVRLERRFPDGVSVVVHEREPMVWLADDRMQLREREEGGYLLDRKGVAIRCDTVRGEYLSLPVIRVGGAVHYGMEKPDPETSIRSGYPVAAPEVQRAVELHRLLRAFGAEEGLEVAEYSVQRHYYLGVTFRSGLEARFAPERPRGQLAKLRATLAQCRDQGLTPEWIDLTLSDTVPVRCLVPRAQPVTEDGPPGGETDAAEEVPEDMEIIPESLESEATQPNPTEP